MPAIVPVVEGRGEIAAFPLLLRRLLAEEYRRFDLTIDHPLAANGWHNLLRAGGIERFLERAALRANAAGIIVLLDLDEADCAADLARELAARARGRGLHLPVAIVVAVQAYEAWFLASIETIRGQHVKGQRFLPAEVEPPSEPETIRSPKDWLKDRLVDDRFYKEKEDMPPLTDLLDCAQVRRRCRSFRRLDHAIGQLVAAIDRQVVAVTP
ncbi:MAG: DUF4276 family protein [Rhodospirillaceae bacterium]|nr:DUF4276 family protein [Rhodospirillaceae bacterium]